MQIVLDGGDFARLSPQAQAELLQLLGARAAGGLPVATSATPTPPPAGRKAGFRWRVPYNVSPSLAQKLVHGLPEDARRRLTLFARPGGRVTMKEMLALTGDTDWRVLSSFIGVLTRKLRRLVGDNDRIISLIMWDFEAEAWDEGRTNLVDGVYYVAEATARSLIEVLKPEAEAA